MMELPPRIWIKIDVTPACWHWTGSRRDGRYGQVQLDKKNWLVHRLMWTATYGPILPGICICHRCDNILCCNPEHLFLGTHAQNSADMVANGRSATGDRNASRLYPDRRPRGERHWKVKLSDDDVANIRIRHAAGESYRMLGRAYGVSHIHIGNIVRGESRV